MEDRHFELDEQPTRFRSSNTSVGRVVAVPGKGGPSNGASAEGDRSDPAMAPIFLRLRRIEQHHRLLGLLSLTVVIAAVIAAFGYLSQGKVLANKSLHMSEELKLVDSSGRPRVSLGLHSEVPVMQVLDAKGRPRLSFGLRFDDTPFIDLSDEHGATRASLQVTSGGRATIRMYNEQGESTFVVH